MSKLSSELDAQELERRRGPLLANANSRRVTPRRISRVAARLEKRGWPVELEWTRSAEEAADLAARAVARRAERVWVAGGDGAVHSVLPALAGSETALGIVPLGTGNVLARELGIPTYWRQAVDVLARGQPVSWDMGLANGEPFALFLGLGLDAEVVRRVDGPMKSWFGRAEFVRTALSLATSYEPFVVRLELDGETYEHRAWMVLVSNATKYAGVLNIVDEAQPDDGILDVWVATAGKPGPRTPAAFLTQALRFFVPRQPMAGEARYRCRSGRISCAESVGLQVDGELRAPADLDVSIRPAALRIVKPG